MRCNNALLFLFLCVCLNSCGIFKKKSSTTATKSKKESTAKSSTKVLEKYSQILGESVDNERLYQYVDGWLGVPYKYGGKTKSGIDCSNFTCGLLREVYQYPPNFYLPSSKLAEQGKKINLSDAKEGDLVFFIISKGSKVSHVGIYLANKKFVHASTSKGVIISSLNEDYYKARYAFVTRAK